MAKALLPTGFIIAVIAAIICIVFYDAVLAALWWFGVVLLGFFGLMAAVTLWAGVEKTLTIRAQRIGEEYEQRRRRYVDFKDGFGMVHLLNLETNVVENLSTYPGTHHNGTWTEPHPAAAAAWHALVGKSRAESPANLLLPATTAQQPAPDLLTVFTQPTQSYAIIGGQQVGKTFQARRIAQHWLQTGINPIVIGPKWDRGEWDNCAMFGGEYNFERVSRGMRIVKKIAEDRHADSKKGHKEHTVQPVFFDDWTAIRAKLEKEAEDFIIDATTLYASVNIILYFIIHLDTANAWGVGKVGAALHQNFIKLRLEPGYNELGLIDRSRTTGYLLMPGQSKKDQRQVTLFSGTGQQVVVPDLIQQSTPDESKVSLMLANGSSRSAIAREVFGDDGGNQLKRVDKIIEKLNP